MKVFPLLLLLMACKHHSEPVVIVTPKQKLSGDAMYMTALLRDAKFFVDKGCLRVHSVGQTNSYLAVFPFGYSVKASRDGHVILDARENEWARTDVVRDIGGGEAPSINSSLFSHELSRCSGPYWFVSP